MNILKFIGANWDSIFFIVAVLAGIIFLAAKKQYAILDRIIFALVTEAEKKFGAGTGAAKLAAVIDWVYPKIPSVIRLFLTAKKLESIIERVLAEAQERWKANPNLTRYISA